MAFGPGDIIRSRGTSRMGKIVMIAPSGRLSVYMLGAGSFIPYSDAELWELVEKADPSGVAPSTLNNGQVVMDRDLMVVIEKQAEMIGRLTNCIAQIQWMSRNYIIRNIKATPQELRAVLRDIDQTVIVTTTGGPLSFVLKATYEDAKHNPFPPGSIAPLDPTP